MKKNRVIPIVLFKNGFVVQSKEFSEYRNLGNPFDSIRRLSEWGADEICFIDISSNQDSNLRSDLSRKSSTEYLEVLREVSRISFMPLSSGGGIKTIEDIELRIRNGADKVIINSAIFESLSFVEEAIHTFGSQCIIASLDVKRFESELSIFSNGGKVHEKQDILKLIDKLQDLGIGELLINSIDRDGKKTGYDLELAETIASIVKVPLIICGGAGEWEHLAEVLRIKKVDAVAAANIFQHVDQSVYLAHRYLYNSGIPVRKPKLLELK